MCALLSSWVAIGLLVGAKAFKSQEECWEVDKTTVIQGGCLSIIVHEACTRQRDLRVQINDRNPMKLIEAGPTYRIRTNRMLGRGATTSLIYQDLINPEGLQEFHDEPGTFRPTSVFDEPGTVSLTLYDGDESLGTKTVIVKPCPPGAREAVELLRPRLGRMYRGQRDEILWMQLFTDRSLGITPRLSDREVQLLRDQLPIMQKHPDWAEIAEMSFFRLEARHHAYSLLEDIDGQSHLRAGVENLDPPKHILEARKRELKSPFAQAIQDEITDPYCSLRAIKTWNEQQKRVKNQE